MTRPFLIGPRSAVRVKQLIEARPGPDGGPDPTPARQTHWVRVTSATPVAGWFPGVVTWQNSAGSWVDSAAAVEVQPVDSSGMTLDRRYPCTRSGISTGGKLRFTTINLSDSFVGTPVAIGAHGGYATVGTVGGLSPLIVWPSIPYGTWLVNCAVNLVLTSAGAGGAGRGFWFASCGPGVGGAGVGGTVNPANANGYFGSAPYYDYQGSHFLGTASLSFTVNAPGRELRLFVSVGLLADPAAPPAAMPAPALTFNLGSLTAHRVNG